MLFSVEQAFAGRDEIRAPLKMPVWEPIPWNEVEQKNNRIMIRLDSILFSHNLMSVDYFKNNFLCF